MALISSTLTFSEIKLIQNLISDNCPNLDSIYTLHLFALLYLLYREHLDSFVNQKLKISKSEVGSNFSTQTCHFFPLKTDLGTAFVFSCSLKKLCKLLNCKH